MSLMSALDETEKHPVHGWGQIALHSGVNSGASGHSSEWSLPDWSQTGDTRDAGVGQLLDTGTEQQHHQGYDQHSQPHDQQHDQLPDTTQSAFLDSHGQFERDQALEPGGGADSLSEHSSDEEFEKELNKYSDDMQLLLNRVNSNDATGAMSGTCSETDSQASVLASASTIPTLPICDLVSQYQQQEVCVNKYVIHPQQQVEHQTNTVVISQEKNFNTNNQMESSSRPVSSQSDQQTSCMASNASAATAVIEPDEWTRCGYPQDAGINLPSVTSGAMGFQHNVPLVTASAIGVQHNRKIIINPITTSDDASAMSVGLPRVCVFTSSSQSPVTFSLSTDKLMESPAVSETVSANLQSTFSQSPSSGMSSERDSPLIDSLMGHNMPGLLQQTSQMVGAESQQQTPPNNYSMLQREESTTQHPSKVILQSQVMTPGEPQQEQLHDMTGVLAQTSGQKGEQLQQFLLQHFEKQAHQQHQYDRQQGNQQQNEGKQIQQQSQHLSHQEQANQQQQSQIVGQQPEHGDDGHQKQQRALIIQQEQAPRQQSVYAQQIRAEAQRVIQEQASHQISPPQNPLHPVQHHHVEQQPQYNRQVAQPQRQQIIRPQYDRQHVDQPQSQQIVRQQQTRQQQQFLVTRQQPAMATSQHLQKSVLVRKGNGAISPEMGQHSVQLARQKGLQPSRINPHSALVSSSSFDSPPRSRMTHSVRSALLPRSGAQSMRMQSPQFQQQIHTPKHSERTIAIPQTRQLTPQFLQLAVQKQQRHQLAYSHGQLQQVSPVHAQHGNSPAQLPQDLDSSIHRLHTGSVNRGQTMPQAYTYIKQEQPQQQHYGHQQQHRIRPQHHQYEQQQQQQQCPNEHPQQQQQYRRQQHHYQHQQYHEAASPSPQQHRHQNQPGYQQQHHPIATNAFNQDQSVALPQLYQSSKQHSEMQPPLPPGPPPPPPLSSEQHDPAQFSDVAMEQYPETSSTSSLGQQGNTDVMAILSACKDMDPYTVYKIVSDNTSSSGNDNKIYIYGDGTRLTPQQLANIGIQDSSEESTAEDIKQAAPSDGAYLNPKLCGGGGGKSTRGGKPRTFIRANDEPSSHYIVTNSGVTIPGARSPHPSKEGTDPSVLSNGRTWFHTNPPPVSSLIRKPLHPEQPRQQQQQQQQPRTHVISTPKSFGSTTSLNHLRMLQQKNAEDVGTTVVFETKEEKCKPATSKRAKLELGEDEFVVCRDCGGLGKDSIACDICHRSLTHNVKIYSQKKNSKDFLNTPVSASSSTVASATSGGGGTVSFVNKQSFYGQKLVEHQQVYQGQNVKASVGRGVNNTASGSSTLHITLVPKTYARSRGRGKRTRPVPETVTISSDEEYSENFCDTTQSMSPIDLPLRQTPTPNSTLGDLASPQTPDNRDALESDESPTFPSFRTPCQMKRRPVMEDIDGKPVLDRRKAKPKKTSPVLPLPDSVRIELLTRAMRIGTIRAEVTAPVVFSKESIQIEFCCNGSSSRIMFMVTDVEMIKFSNTPIPIIFLYGRASLGKKFCDILHFKHNSDDYYDPCSTKVCQKLIILFLRKSLLRVERAHFESIIKSMEPAKDNNDFYSFVKNKDVHDLLFQAADLNPNKAIPKSLLTTCTGEENDYISPDEYGDDWHGVTANANDDEKMGAAAAAAAAATTEQVAGMAYDNTSGQAEQASDNATVTATKPQSATSEPAALPTTIAGFTGTVEKLLTYPPPPEKGGITITNEDLYCLNEGEFLNDVIIDFYLKYLLIEKLSEVDKTKTYVFSSFFYKRLSQRLSKGDSNEELSKQPLPVRRHDRVKNWTRHVDLFAKDFIIVPINEHSHWFLAIICFPGMDPKQATASGPQVDPSPPGTEDSEQETPDNSQHAFDTSSQDVSSSVSAPDDDTQQSSRSEEPMDHSESQTEDEQPQQEQPTSTTSENGLESEGTPDEQEPAGDSTDASTNATISEDGVLKQPCILVFDSLAGPSRSSVVKTLREYLEVEWQMKKNCPHQFGKGLRGGHPKVPQQDNFSDCGVYVLQYTESFFEKPLKNFSIPMRILDWFPVERIKSKREEIRNGILDLKEKLDRERIEKMEKQQKHSQQTVSQEAQSLAAHLS